MTSFIDLSNYLSIPFSYLLQDLNLEQLTNLRDINNYSLLHCAVLSNNTEKVIELAHSNFPLDLLTNNSEINFELIKKLVPFEFSKSMNIYFSKDGYTPLHLNLFLLNYYMTFKPEKKEFTIQQFKIEQEKILNIFIENDEDCLSILDARGFSLFDYAFLFENTFLINKFFNLDSTFKNLHFVKPSTALDILKIIKVKETKKTIKNLYHEEINSQIFNNLHKKLLNDKLTMDLNTKSSVKSVNKI